MRVGQLLGRVKVNHVWSMDGLKLFAESRKEIESLMAMVQMISKDIGLESGIAKCGLTILKRMKISKSHEVNLESGEIIKEVGEKEYKHLRFIERDNMDEHKMKELYQKKYLKRTWLLLQPKLNGRHKIITVNTWAVALMRYGSGIVF